MVGIPPRHSYADITVALVEVDLHKQTAWATLLVEMTLATLLIVLASCSIVFFTNRAPTVIL